MCSEWPIIISHLSSDNTKLIGPGLMTNRELQGHESGISSEIRHSTTIIEFTSDGNPVRTDAPFIERSMDPACSLFRKENPHINADGKLILDKEGKRKSGNLCWHCDNIHAKLFHKLDNKTISEEEILRRRESSEELKNIYKKSEVPSYFKPNYNKERSIRFYLEYDCPLLGFRELLFPIFFKHDVIAVFFIGQLTLKNRIESINELISTIQIRFPDCFINAKGRPDDIINKMLYGHKEYLEDPDSFESRILSEDDYNNLINRIIKEIISFEEILIEKHEHLQHEYIRKSIMLNNNIKNFIKDSLHLINENNEKDDENEGAVVAEWPLKETWRNFKKPLEQIVDNFSLRYAIAFGSSSITSIDSEPLSVQEKVGNWRDVFPEENILDKIAIPIDQEPFSFEEGYIVYSNNDIDLGGIIQFPEDFDTTDLGEFQLIILPVPLNKSSSIAFLFGYNDGLCSIPEHASNNYYHQSLRSFFTTIVLGITAIRIDGLEKLRKRQFQYLGHESGQMTSGLSWMGYTYQDPSDLEARLPQDHDSQLKGFKKKLTDMSKDLLAYTRLMWLVFEIAERLGTGKLVDLINITKFKPYGDVLAKWQDAYRFETDRKHLQIRPLIPEFYEINGVASREHNPFHPEMWADRDLFEMVVYNLINNAVKYAHRGTKIFMDCRIEDKDDREAPHILTITNYGDKLDPNDENIFLPFRRGQFTKTNTKGLGLGLYVVKLIIEDTFGGRVIPKCDVDKPISEYNVPLIDTYINTYFEGRDIKLIPELISERKKLKEKDTYDSIIAMAENNVPKYNPKEEFVTLEKEINKKTYEVKMRIEIPRNPSRRRK